MTQSDHLGDLEKEKFTRDLLNRVCVRIAPGAITDTDGNSLEIDGTGRGYVYDQYVHHQLKNVYDKLDQILEQLEYITGMNR